jgi:hypothetical protein
MLADSVEAAARCLHQPSRDSLARLISDIVRDKMEDGQFDECRLTFHEVKLITEAFLHVLTAMMHARIDYPKEFPKTASGIPMELVRSDLRPEGSLTGLAATESLVSAADLSTDTAAALVPPISSISPLDISHDALLPADPAVALGVVGLDEPTAAVQSFGTARRPTPPILPPPRALITNEEWYADLTDERAKPQSPNGADD